MFVEKNFEVKVNDIEKNNKISNTAILTYLEETAKKHSDIAGFGISNIDKTKMSWILLNWKVKLFYRPALNDKLKIKTWSRKIDRYYAFRDFEIYNAQNEVIGIATSKWVIINIDTKKISKISKEIIDSYESENVSIFDEEISDIKYQESYFDKKEIIIDKNMIDINNHVHNTYYMDFAKEVIPTSIFNECELNYFEIMYKKGIKLEDKINAYYEKTKNSIEVLIKNSEEKLNAVIKFYL